MNCRSQVEGLIADQRNGAKVDSQKPCSLLNPGFRASVLAGCLTGLPRASDRLLQLPCLLLVPANAAEFSQMVDLQLRLITHAQVDLQHGQVDPELSVRRSPLRGFLPQAQRKLR